MPIEPPGKISGLQIVRREENAAQKQKKKQTKKEQPKQEQEKTGKIDIKI
jgi:hypothetical protein